MLISYLIYARSSSFILSKFVKITLRSQLFVRIVVVLPFREHIIDQPDGQQVEVGDVDTELCTAQQKERGALFSQSVPSLLRLKSL